MSRFVKTELVRIELSDSDWIEIKKDLNNGEIKQLEASGNGIPVRLADNTVHTPIDWSIYELERALIFLTDWSFKDDQDKPVALTLSALKALDADSFNELNKAIFAHVTKRNLEKKTEKQNRLKIVEEATLQ